MSNEIANNMADTIHFLEEDNASMMKSLTNLQLAYNEQMIELREAKELLREAVNSLYFNYHYASKAEIRLCYCDKCLKDAHCAKDTDKCNFVWWKRDELLKLFKGD